MCRLVGVPIGPDSLDEQVTRAVRAVRERQGQVVFACANPHSLALAQNDRSFMAALRAANSVVADGVGVLFAGRLLGIDVGPRISGYEYFSELCRNLESIGSCRVFFFGSSDEVLRGIQRRIEKDFPGLIFAGGLSPPFGSWSQRENTMMIEKINAAEADVLWVGMTAPKQEKWVHQNQGALNSAVIGSIGAVFDFYAGTARRAPDWMRALGLEWLFRLCLEPRRMWRRTFVSVPRFMMAVVKRHLL